jgi:hypothetical protein
MQKFYYRLENSETTFPLLYNAFLESKDIGLNMPHISHPYRRMGLIV